MITKTTKTTAKIYTEGIGRRKTSIARVRITSAAKSAFFVNTKTLEDYFHNEQFQQTALAPLVLVESKEKFVISVLAKGGGISSQANAVAHGLARALEIYNAEWRAPLKKASMLTRDSRMKERRKFGLKKARKAPQWSKR